MRNESIFDSLQKIAGDEPSLWAGIQKAVNKYNENHVGKKNISMFDVLADRGQFGGGQMAHINAAEDKMLGNVPDVPYQGRNGDDRMARLSPRQMAFLKAMGGAGTTNPETGQPEFYWGGGADGSWGGDDGGWGGAGDAGGGWAGAGPGGDWGDAGGVSGSFGGAGNDGGFDFSAADVGAPEMGGLADTADTEAGVFGDESFLAGPNTPMAGAAVESGGSAPQFGGGGILSDMLGAAKRGMDRAGREVSEVASTRSRANQAMSLGSMIGTPGLAVGTLGGMIGNLAAQDMFGRGLDELSDDEYASFMAATAGPATPESGNDAGGGPPPSIPPQTMAPAAATPAPVEKPSYWDFQGTPLQQRTGAATEALFGRSIFRSPEAQSYWKQLARQSISPLDPPVDIDYQYLTRVLGQERPATVQAFLDALA